MHGPLRGRANGLDCFSLSKEHDPGKVLFILGYTYSKCLFWVTAQDLKLEWHLNGREKKVDFVVIN
jgi:hypothetical protein